MKVQDAWVGKFRWFRFETEDSEIVESNHLNKCLHLISQSRDNFVLDWLLKFKALSGNFFAKVYFFNEIAGFLTADSGCFNII